MVHLAVGETVLAPYGELGYFRASVRDIHPDETVRIAWLRPSAFQQVGPEEEGSYLCSTGEDETLRMRHRIEDLRRLGEAGAAAVESAGSAAASSSGSKRSSTDEQILGAVGSRGVQTVKMSPPRTSRSPGGSPEMVSASIKVEEQPTRMEDTPLIDLG